MIHCDSRKFVYSYYRAINQKELDMVFLKRYFIMLIALIMIQGSSYANTFVFYPKKFKWVAIDNSGQVVKSGKASGGSHYCRDLKRACHTPVGRFTIQSMQGAGCRSSRYPLGKGGSKMPYCSFFSQYYAVHGSYHVPNYNASHGCIRVTPSDAKWLQQHFMQIGDTTVVVKPY